jgi:hypothetical protein
LLFFFYLPNRQSIFVDRIHSFNTRWIYPCALAVWSWSALFAFQSVNILKMAHHEMPRLNDGQVHSRYSACQGLRNNKSRSIPYLWYLIFSLSYTTWLCRLQLRKNVWKETMHAYVFPPYHFCKYSLRFVCICQLYEFVTRL